MMMGPPIVQQRLEGLLQRLQGGRRTGLPGRWLGLDLGSHSLRLVELERTASGWRLIRHLVQDVPVTAEGRPSDWVGWLQSALKEFDLRELHLAVSGPQIVLRRVSVPMMSAQELPEAVKWQIKDQVPFPIQEAMLDVRVLGEVWEKDVKKLDVLVAAAPAALLVERVALVERAGARVVSLVPASLALWSCVAALVPDAAQASVVLIEFGAQTTHVGVIKDGVLRVARDLAIGSAHMTDALVGVVASEQGEITIDRPLAESLKRRYGVLMQASEGASEEGVPLFHIASLLRPVLEQLVTELSRFLDFYKVQMDGGAVSRVLLCGGGANLKSLQPFLADGLGLTVEVVNPLARLTDRAQMLEPEQIADEGPGLASAMGAALDHGQGLNLLPTQIRRARTGEATRQLGLRATKAAAACALVIYLGMQVGLFMLGQRVHRQQAVWEKLEPGYAQALHVLTTRRLLESSIDAMGQAFEREPLWDGVFKELGAVIPSAVELSELSVSPDEPTRTLQIRLRGHVAAAAASAQASIAEFVEALEASPFVASVTLAGSQMQTGTPATTFELHGRLE